MVRGSKSDGGEIFRIVQTGSGACPASCTMGKGSLSLRVKRQWRGADYQPPSSAKVTVRVELGRAMAQAVSRRPLTAEAWVRSRVSPCRICGRQSGTGTGFSPSTSVFRCQFHPTGVPLHGKTKKKLIIFITGLHNKPRGCRASVASAAGPFTTKIKEYNYTCTFLGIHGEL